jgi:hypothetical protein
MKVDHDIRNHLAVAIANVEGIRDGVLTPSHKRLTIVLNALDEVDTLLRSRCENLSEKTLKPRYQHRVRRPVH